MRWGSKFVVLALGVCSSAASAQTDFGVRSISGPVPKLVVAPLARVRVTGEAFTGIGSVARIAARWGEVTSTYRSPEHNRAVGGVPNSYHLRGRAMDLVRRPGVSHAQVAASLRAMGYSLAESLDEGDHSHFAFNGIGALPSASTLEPTTVGLHRQRADEAATQRFVVPHEPDDVRDGGSTTVAAVVVGSRLNR